MKNIILPNTALGRWSAGLLGGFIVFIALFFGMVAAGQRGGDTFFSNLSLAIPALMATVSAIAAFFTGVIGIIISKERAILVFLATAIGLFVIIYVLAEIIAPHQASGITSCVF
jgi:ABC-type Na+ efflux pump permease subunit